MNNVLLLSPHCDDAPLSVGAALLNKIFGIEPEVVIVFSVSRYTKDYPCNGPLQEITAIRNAEERSAALRAGYRTRFLGFGEPFVRPGFRVIGDIMDSARLEEREGVWEEVCTTIENVIVAHGGFIMAPLACGGHIDHRIVRQSVLRCLDKNPDIGVGFYEDLPYSEELTDEEIDFHVSSLSLALHPWTINTGLEEKLSLLQVYESQLTSDQFAQVRNYWKRRSGERLWLPSISKLTTL